MERTLLVGAVRGHLGGNPSAHALWTGTNQAIRNFRCTRKMKEAARAPPLSKREKLPIIAVYSEVKLRIEAFGDKPTTESSRARQEASSTLHSSVAGAAVSLRHHSQQ